MAELTGVILAAFPVVIDTLDTLDSFRNRGRTLQQYIAELEG
jgi:hypothetical protein